MLKKTNFVSSLLFRFVIYYVKVLIIEESNTVVIMQTPDDRERPSCASRQDLQQLIVAKLRAPNKRRRFVMTVLILLI